MNNAIKIGALLLFMLSLGYTNSIAQYGSPNHVTWDTYWNNRFIRDKKEYTIAYYTTISGNYSVTDKKGKGIKSVKFKIEFPNEFPRYGFSTDKGEIKMLMSIANGASRAKVTISAKGYRTKRILYKKFRKENKGVFTLKKRISTKSL